jgi:type II secretory pathway pseudopilin PulG
MRNQLVSVAVAGVLALAAAPKTQAQSSEALAALKAQIEALQDKVEQLEQQQKTQQESQDRITDTVAQTKAGTGEWVGRFTWKGDLRYRHENVDPEEAVTDQTRHRIRARFGFAAKVNDTVTGVVQLATNAGNSDPRSRNQTLGEGWTSKGIGIDLAYLDWKPVSGTSTLNVQLGKMAQPWAKVPSYFFDNDITPEGGAVKFTHGAFFASAFGYWLSERAAAADATLLGAQLGMTGNVGAAKLTGAIGYFDVGAVEGEQTAQPTGCTSTFNNVFFGGSQGNSTVTVGGCPFLANDFNLIDALVQAEMKVGTQPLVLFAEYLQNQEASDLDTGYSAGFVVGKASNAHTWEFGYTYQKMEKDAQFAQLVDSDFGGGVTDTQGSVFKVGYAPAKGWTLNGTYFMNDRFVDVGTQRDYDRYQIDLSYKF